MTASSSSVLGHPPTGDTSAAVAYGAIARYARMRHGACYASAQRLGDDLGWTRQRFMRQARRLLSLGLIVCDNPAAEGVTRVYRAVPRQEWEARTAAAGASPPDAPADPVPPPPPSPSVTPCARREPVAPRTPPVTPRTATRYPARNRIPSGYHPRRGERGKRPSPARPAAPPQPAARRPCRPTGG